LNSPTLRKQTHIWRSSASEKSPPISAERWLRGLFSAILTLSDMPARCPVTPESDELGVPVRHLIYGKRSASFRIIFDIQDQAAEGPRVRVLRIWRGARDAVAAQDVETEH